MTQKNNNGINYSEYTLKSYRDKAFSRYARRAAEAACQKTDDGNTPKTDDVIDVNPHDVKKAEAGEIFSGGKPGIKEESGGKAAESDGQDGAAAPQNDGTPSNGYIKSLERRVIKTRFLSLRKMTKTKKAALFLCAAIMLTSICAVVLETLSGGAVLSAAIGGKSQTVTYYAALVGEFDSLAEAKNRAVTVMSDGAAGYVVYDKNYKLVGDVFLNQKDAESFKNTFPEYFSGTYKITVRRPIGLFKYSRQEERRIDAVSGFSESVYNELFFGAKAIESRSLDIPSCRARIKTLTAHINALSDSLDARENDKPIFKKIKNDLTATTAALVYLTTDAALSPSYAANIRYTYVMILNLHRTLAAEM
ncbi:MAG: hypothetical protein LBQ40_06860 [Clostridiales bacterium]|jgi:hypothetical protein|nr:hypothetical protein [Clostridiales bacterium]